MKISQENQKAIEKLARDLRIPAAVVLDNIVTDYRARHAAQHFENVTAALYAFAKHGDEEGSEVLLEGAGLYDYLVAQYRLDYRMARERHHAPVSTSPTAFPDMTQEALQAGYRTIYRIAGEVLDGEPVEAIEAFFNSDALSLDNLGGWAGMQAIIETDDRQTVRNIFRKWMNGNR